MDDADFARIETSLEIRLPQAYRRLLAPIPRPWRAGNSDDRVWDDADALIALNRRARAGSEDWPPWLFAIGQAEGDPGGFAIDARSPSCPLWWLEQMELGPSSGEIGLTFEEWFRESAAAEDPATGGDGLLVFVLVWLGLTVLGVVGAVAWFRSRGFPPVP